jgi:preprotein translocase subunit SecG
VFAFFISIHVLVCVALILVVLLQAGRGGGLAGFGSGTAQTFFGGRGAVTFLAKATSWLAVAFMTMSVLLAVMSSRGQSSGTGLLQQRARARSAQAQLPPSTSSFSPGASDSSAPIVPAPSGAPVVPAPATSAPAPAPAPAKPAPAAGNSK